MAKAILVMDMPSGCVNCSLYGYAVSRCNAKDKFQNNISDDFKPDWCPLKPMPEKKMIEMVQEDYDGGYSHGFTHGFNACIDEICGKE